jgi:hypothetical protein
MYILKIRKTCEDKFETIDFYEDWNKATECLRLMKDDNFECVKLIYFETLSELDKKDAELFLEGG